MKETLTVTGRDSQGNPVTTSVAVLIDAVAITTVVARNRLAAVTWDPPPGVTSTTVAATAAGQPAVSVTVPESATTAVLDGVAPLDTNGNPITWSVTVTCTTPSGDRTTTTSIVPELVKPTTATAGVPQGVPGDIRTPAGPLTPITAASLIQLHLKKPGALVVGYDVDCTASSAGLYADNITFRNCRFNGISGNFYQQVSGNGGGIWRPATFIDCEFNGQGTSTLSGSIPTNTGANNGVLVARSFLRCHLHGFIHLLDNHVGDMRHCLLNEVVYQPGANPPQSQTHSDVFQWFTGGAHPGYTIGPVVIQGNAADMNTPHANAMIQTSPFTGTNPPDRFVNFLFEHNWCDGDAGYFFSGVWPPGQDPSQVVFRSNRFGLNVGRHGMFYPGWRNGVTWANNTWEITGTNSLGQQVTAGQAIA